MKKQAQSNEAHGENVSHEDKYIPSYIIMNQKYHKKAYNA